MREKQTRLNVNGVNCKGARGSGLHRRENSDKKECICESEQERWSEKENEGETAAECYCAFLSGRQSNFIARSFTMSS